MSAVVIQELAAGAADNSGLQAFNASRIAYEREGSSSQRAKTGG
jgi:hypothetical protein